MTRPTLKNSYKVLLALTLIMLPNFAHATGGVYCMSKDEQAQISVGMGHVPIYTPINAYAKYGDKEWSSTPRDGEMQMGDSQGLIEDKKLSIDFADEQTVDIIISLRVETSGEEDDYEYEGTLTFEDGIPHTVYCLFE